MKRVLHITNIPTPYRIPQLNELQRQLAALGGELRVVFAAHTYRRRRWEVDMSQCTFAYEVLGKGIPLGRRAERTTFAYGGLYRVIRAYAPDVIIVTGFSMAAVKVWLRSFWRRTPYLIFSGSIDHPERLASRLRRWQRRLVVSRAAGAVAYGSRARAYLTGLGLPEASVSVAINTVDTTFFQEATEALRAAAAPADAPASLTYVGYLVPRKNVHLLIDVAAHLARTRRDFRLEIVGDGAERERLEARVRAEGMEDLVVFHGYQQKDDLPRFLARSRAFLFPTACDIWGLVLNEAMAAGVPCVASVHAGATHDLIREGETGFKADFEDVGATARRVAWLLDHPAEAAAIGQRASRFVTEHASPARSAAGFVQAILNV